MIRLVALGALLLGACSDLQAIDAGACGNGVVERGEDCDADNSRCVACGIRCDEERRCDTYPGTSGFVCGADDFCHAPGGTFRDPATITTAADSLRVTDIDADRIGDLLIQSPTALEVMSGNFEGQPRTSTFLLTPLARGPASYTFLDDVDGDSEPDTYDVLVPTADGIAAYTSKFGVLSPYPFPSPIGNELGEPMWGTQIAPQLLAFVGANPVDANQLLLITLQVGIGAPTVLTSTVLCGATPADFDPDDMETYATATSNLFVTALGGASPRLCILSIDKPAATYSATVLPLATAAPLLRRPVLAPLRGACPSLVFREASGAIVEYSGIAGGGTDCAFDTTRQIVSGAPASTPVGFAPLAPARNGRTHALVFATGIYAFSTSAPLDLVHASDRALTRTQFADIDLDGDTDVFAAAAAFDGGPSTDDVDVLYREPGGLFDGFVQYRFDTEGPIRYMLLDDYDGNGLVDMAFVQRRLRLGEERDELAIAYGTNDRLLPGIAVGTFQNVRAVLQSDIPDSSDQTGKVADIAIMHDIGTSTTVSLLHGSPQRTMIAYFDPRVEGPFAFNTSVYRGAVAGELTAEGLPGHDILAINDVLASNMTKLWLSQGPTGGVTMNQQALSAPGLVRCTGVPSGVFCIDGARYVTVPAEAVDRVLGVDVFGRGITFAPIVTGSPAAIDVRPWNASVVGLPAGATPRAFEVIRPDASMPLLVIGYTAASGPGLVLCAVDDTGQPSGCADLGAAIAAQHADPTLVCLDATTARVAAVARFGTSSPTSDVVALCRGSGGAALFDISIDALGLTGVSATELRPVEPADQLYAGDINGDAVDDLITIDRGTAIPTIRIYTQCTSRNIAGCVGPGGSN
jgi:hypothetical protein